MPDVPRARHDEALDLLDAMPLAERSLTLSYYCARCGAQLTAARTATCDHCHSFNCTACRARVEAVEARWRRRQILRVALILAWITLAVWLLGWILGAVLG